MVQDLDGIGYVDPLRGEPKEERCPEYVHYLERRVERQGLDNDM